MPPCTGAVDEDPMPSILIVEDEVVITMVLERTLTAQVYQIA